jgi:uncharacterized protein YbjT (DUF2867 family)
MTGTMTGMRVLVTGATGNIGRLVVDHLLRRDGVEVRALTPVSATSSTSAAPRARSGGPSRPRWRRPASRGRTWSRASS